MSYILDALRKSEQQRTRGAAPSLLVVPVADAPQRRPMTLRYGLLAVVLLAGGIAIGTLRPWQSETAPPTAGTGKPQVVTPASAPQTPPPAHDTATKGEPRPVVAVAPPATIPGPAPAPATAPVAPATAPSIASAPARTAAPVPAPSGASVPATAAIPAASDTAKAAPAASEPPAPSAPKPAEAAAPRTPIAFGDLPLAVQQEMPKVTVQFHLYSGNPKDRLAGINDRMLREGDAIQPGLVLEQITPDGMVLSFKGYRFLRGAR